MAKLKLPFELEKPSSNEYVTKTSEIGHRNEVLDTKIEGMSSDVNNLKTKGVFKYDDANHRLSICDSDGNIIAILNGAFEIRSDGTIVTSSFDSSNITFVIPENSITKEQLNSGLVSILPSVYGDSNNKFSVCDGNGNIIAKLNGAIEIKSDGTIRTANFDSSNITKEQLNSGLVSILPSVYGDSNNKFSVCDSDGNIIAIFNSGISIDSDGTIRTANFNSSQIETGNIRGARTQVPNIDFRKPTFRWLDIGNSHSLCALKYLRYIAISQGVDLSNVAFCRLSRGNASFNSMYNGYHDSDTESGDVLTGKQYRIQQEFGGLKVHIKGTIYNASTGQTENVDKDIDRSPTVFYGTNTSVMRSLLADNEWDLITIHQGYTFNDKYDESDGWTKVLDPEDQIANIGNSDCADKFVQLLRTLCPNAAIGNLFALVPFGYDGTSYNPAYDSDSLDDTVASHNRWCETMKKFKRDSGIDLIIPCDTALTNLRISDVANEGNETILSRYGFNYDVAHTNSGVAAYTMAAVAWEVVFAPRFGKSIYGNNISELPEDDLHTSTTYYVQPSYIDDNNEKVIIDASDGAWQKPVWSGKTTNDGGTTWNEGGRAKSFVRVSNSNRKVCQMAAILAVNNMWKVINPQDVDL